MRVSKPFAIFRFCKVLGVMETQMEKAKPSCLLSGRRVLCQRLAVVHGLQGLEGAVGPAQLLLQGGQRQARLQVLRCHFHHLGVALCGQLHAAQSLQTLCGREGRGKRGDVSRTTRQSCSTPGSTSTRSGHVTLNVCEFF